jgi:hypothetical protein
MMVRRSGDGFIMAMARFEGKSDHDGLRQSFADLIRAVAPKLKG